MPNDNVKVVRQHEMAVAWIRLRHMKKFKKQNRKNSKLFLFKNPSNNKSNKNDINNNSDDNNNNNKMPRQI